MKALSKLGQVSAVLLAFFVYVSPSFSQVGDQPNPQPPNHQAGQAVEIKEYLSNDQGALAARLSNGLVVIIKPTRVAPVVSVRGYVRAGGILEGQYLGAGISHLLEHMVAEGVEQDSDRDSLDQLERESERAKRIGGQTNAYTTLDHTCYHISAASGKADECIDLVAGWLVGAQITAEQFNRQQEVVSREIQTSGDDPADQLHHMHQASLYGTHPAAVPVIGYRQAMEALSLEDALDYHARMYVPQNMVFVVVGDVDAPAALERVRLAFENAPPGRIPQLDLPQVWPIGGVIRSVGSHPALNQTLQRMSFMTVPLLHDDLYALDVLSYVLTNGPASRLVRTIQRQQSLVISIDSVSWTPVWGPGPFTISFRSQPQKADQAEAEIFNQLRDIIENGIGRDELDRAKRQKLADLVHSRQTVDSQAALLGGDFLATGDMGFTDSYTRRIQSVTAEQVQQSARKYFDFGRVVITRLEPPKAEVAQAQTNQISTPAASVYKLPNGLGVILHPVQGAGLVSMSLVTRGGLLTETEQTNGLGTAMTYLTTKGAAGRDAEQIAAFFDSAGGAVRAECGNNTFYWQASVLEDSFEQALKVFADIVVRPDFPDSELEIARPLLLSAVASVEENWLSQLQRFFRREFFTTDSPYRLLSVGTDKVLADLTTDQLKAHHRRFVLGGDSVLSIYGSFDTDLARKLVESLFADLPCGTSELPNPPPVKIDQPIHKVLATSNKVAGVIAAFPGTVIENVKDRLALDVLDTIISGYQMPSGWLHEQLRGKGLVYVVHAYNWAGLAPGAFITYSACESKDIDEVVGIIRDNLRRACNYTPTQQEVDEAVNTILTAELLDAQSLESLSLSSALDELYGLGWDFKRRLEDLYRQISPQDVLAVGLKYLSGPPAIFVTIPAEQDKQESPPTED